MLGRVLVIATSVAVMLAACSSDGGTDREDYVEAATEGLTAVDEFDLDDGDIACVAEAVVDGIGAGTLSDADVSAADLTGADSLADLDLEIGDADLVDAIAERFRGCDVDLAPFFGDDVTAQFEGLGLNDDEIDCIVAELVESPQMTDAMGDVFAEGIVTGDIAGARDIGFEAGTTAAPAAFARCPDAMVTLLTQGGGLTVDDEARACLVGEVEAAGEEAVTVIVEQGREAVSLVQGFFETCGLSPGP